ncbi:9665_t:CDS:2, partial [Diversispora eburnea]
ISTSPNKNVSISEAEKLPLNHNKDLNIQDTNLSSSESKSSIISSSNWEQSAISSEIKISYNQKVEQGLICELFEFIRSIDFVSLQDPNKTPPNCIYSKQFSDILVGIDLTPGSISHLAQLFDKTEKTGQKEKLRWYYYSEEYEKKVITISSENNISDQMARTQIYDEMMLYLPGIKREYKNETELDPWIMSETPELPQIEEDCIIKIFKFPEEKSVIHDVVHKCFPFLTYTNSNAWHQDVFKYTDPEAKCSICKEVHTHLGIWDNWSCLEVKPKKFLSITEAKKKRWTMECFRADLKRDICLYRGGIERNEDTRKYHKFLTDRDRLVGEELLRCDILKSGLSTAWLDDLMEEWKKIHTQFTQIFN